MSQYLFFPLNTNAVPLKEQDGILQEYLEQNRIEQNKIKDKDSAARTPVCTKLKLVSMNCTVSNKYSQKSRILLADTAISAAQKGSSCWEDDTADQEQKETGKTQYSSRALAVLHNSHFTEVSAVLSNLLADAESENKNLTYSFQILEMPSIKLKSWPYLPLNNLY